MNGIILIVGLTIGAAAFVIGQEVGHPSNHGFFQTADMKWVALYE